MVCRKAMLDVKFRGVRHGVVYKGSREDTSSAKRSFQYQILKMSKGKTLP